MATIKCSQNGNTYTTSLKRLAKEDGSLSSEDLVPGTELMWEYKGKSYPVKLVELKGI